MEKAIAEPHCSSWPQRSNRSVSTCLAERSNCCAVRRCNLCPVYLLSRWPQRRQHASDSKELRRLNRQRNDAHIHAHMGACTHTHSRTHAHAQTHTHMDAHAKAYTRLRTYIKNASILWLKLDNSFSALACLSALLTDQITSSVFMHLYISMHVCMYANMYRVYVSQGFFLPYNSPTPFFDKMKNNV